MNIFVINSGSSSIKYQLFKMPLEEPVCSGIIDRIGLQGSVLIHRVFQNGREDSLKRDVQLPNHEAALREVVSVLTNAQTGVIQHPGEIDVVGHRVVHGGELFAVTTLINERVKEEIKKLFPLAPLHNPANFTGIEVAEKIFPQAKQVAVFDTAFHQTMPGYAFRFAIPSTFYNQNDIRVYGFHGTSHKFVSEQAAKYLNNPAAKIISIHLGNGCSMAAVNAGKSIDTSMGFGPLSGLIMGTRSGDIDPSVIFYLVNELGYSIEDVKTLLNRQSGMLGLTGKSDMRDILSAIEKGDQGAVLALNMYVYRIKKYIGAYAAILNGLDAVVFTAGVGENSAEVRQAACHNLEYLGITIDKERNTNMSQKLREINIENAKVKVLVVPTNEELEIARQSFALLSDTKEAG